MRKKDDVTAEIEAYYAKRKAEENRQNSAKLHEIDSPSQENFFADAEQPEDFGNANKSEEPYIETPEIRRARRKQDAPIILTSIGIVLLLVLIIGFAFLLPEEAEEDETCLAIPVYESTVETGNRYYAIDSTVAERILESFQMDIVKENTVLPEVFPKDTFYNDLICAKKDGISLTYVLLNGQEQAERIWKNTVDTLKAQNGAEEYQDLSEKPELNFSRFSIESQMQFILCSRTELGILYITSDAIGAHDAGAIAEEFYLAYTEN